MSVLVCLQYKFARWGALAVLREPISLFRLLIADKMGYKKWPDLPGDLRLERNRGGPVRTALEDALQSEGLSIATWDDLGPITNAGNNGFYTGITLSTEELLEKANQGLLPSDVSSSQGPLTIVLREHGH